MKNFKNNNGVTLVEVIIVVSILFGAIGLLRSGSDFVFKLMGTQAFLEKQRLAQESLYQITRDVRGARNIIEVSSSTLSLRIFDYRLSFDVAISTSIFDSVHLGTVTYRYREVNGSTFIQRDTDFGDRRDTKLFLENILEPENPETIESEFVFSASPYGSAPPYLGANIVLRCGKGVFKDRVRTYRANVQIRSRV